MRKEKRNKLIKAVIASKGTKDLLSILRKFGFYPRSLTSTSSTTTTTTTL